jgi:hypothetical protein
MKDDEAIFAYSRKQAIADGALIDVTEVAQEAGFRYPVALTRAVWCRYVEVPPGVTGQDYAGRLWDILHMLRFAIRRRQDTTSEIFFQLHVQNDNRTPKLVTLKSVCGPDDDGSPCITVMMTDED